MKLLGYLLAGIMILGIGINDVHSQKQKKKNRHVAAADEAFNNERYSLAAVKYKKAYTKVKRNKLEKNRIAVQLAASYRMTNETKRAEAAYKRAIRLNDVDKQPRLLYYYAEMLRSNGKYELALEQYREYLVLKPEDTLALVGFESCQTAVSWIENPTNYQIENQKKINSKQDDFAAAYADKFYSSVIFTSAREGSTGKEDDEWTSQSFSDLFYAKQDRTGKWSTPVLAEKGETVNTKGNEGSAAFNSSFSTMYFTRCPNEDDKSSGCQIYVSKRSGKKFNKAELLELGKDTTVVYAHPTLSSDELSLILVSNIKGGRGGKDLYVATRSSKSQKFGPLENLGSVINTPGDEMFPFLRNDSVLYFSSNGHLGLGGLDIFRSVKVLGKWTKPENMKSPLNSNYDEFGISFHEEDEQGYFASNRKGGRGGDDIYYFTNPPLKFTLAGVIKDNRTLQFVDGAKIKLEGSDGSSVTAKTDPKGFYSFSPSQIKPGTSYEISVEMPDYFNMKATESTVGIERNQDLIRDFMLDPIPDEPVALPDILYDLAKWDLKPQYQDSLQGLIETLDVNETIIIELASHTDARDSEERNDILSQKRAQSAVDYLVLRGINPNRMIAKGYGERAPLRIRKDVVKAGYTFKEGTVLTEEFIETLPTNEIKEAAHQMNRRTEFSVLSLDFVPEEKIAAVGSGKVDIIVNPEENVIKYSLGAGNTVKAACIINGYTTTFSYVDYMDGFQISQEQTLKFLNEGAISKDDFLGDPEKILGQGLVADKAQFIIREMRIANITITDVEFTVNHKLEVPVTIGEEAMKQFGTFRLDEQNFKIIFE
ncbi:MAG: OmpA family protein [Bacteroidales bacterium]|nr:OmpA family protein [Bacteroidales bacterium]